MNPLACKFWFQCLLLSAALFPAVTKATVIDFEDVIPNSVVEPCFESAPVGCTQSSLDWVFALRPRTTALLTMHTLLAARGFSPFRPRSHTQVTELNILA